jgi:NADH:ubiquinone oxidoreductase subunit C
LNGIVPFFYKIFGSGINDIKVVSGLEVELKVASKKIYPLIFFLNKHSLCMFKIMIDIICSDMPGKPHRFFLVYNLLSVQFNIRVRVMSKIKENMGQLLSLVSLYRSVSWSEREVFDFFGLFFFENSDLRRILNDYGFKGFPLRKDFPLTGYIDTYYDDNKKKICYRKLYLTQEYRNFNFKSSWKFD